MNDTLAKILDAYALHPDYSISKISEAANVSVSAVKRYRRSHPEQIKQAKESRQNFVNTRSVVKAKKNTPQATKTKNQTTLDYRIEGTPEETQDISKILEDRLIKIAIQCSDLTSIQAIKIWYSLPHVLDHLSKKDENIEDTQKQAQEYFQVMNSLYGQSLS